MKERNRKNFAAKLRFVSNYDNEVTDMTTQELLQKAKAAKGAMALADTETKNRALLAMADALKGHCADILAANALDMEAARGSISDVMLDRLALNADRVAGMASAGWSGPTGWSLRRRRCLWG